MRPPPASESRMKLKPLTVADIAALAACYREIDAASKAGNDGPMMAGLAVDLGPSALLLCRPQDDDSTPPDIIAANQAQFADFDAAAADFAEALSSLDMAATKR